jgi:hypothetical protein
MRKLYLTLALLSMSVVGINAQTLLDEGFETDDTVRYSSNIATGWTTIDQYTGNTARYRWCNYYYDKGQITGKHCAMCDAPMYSSSTDGDGPREEILLTPELTLNDTYQLSFDWQAASASALDENQYDFQIRVACGHDTTTIWSFHNAEQLKNSGVMTYPWTGWQIYNSKVDLSDFKGKTVKICFVYKMMAKEANVLYLDNVSVKQHTPETQPIGQLSSKLYNFGEMYVGEKHYSEKITLKNIGLSGLKINEIVLPDGVGTTLDKEKVNLDKNESVDFQVSYKASLTSATDDKIILKTTGGDLEIRVIAKKNALPDGNTLETFEETNFPPAGWQNDSWTRSYYAIEGDYSAVASVSLGDQILISPRMDLSAGKQNLMFTYFNDFNSENGDTYPSNDFYVDFSKDGGTTWKQLWITDYTNTNVLETITLELDGEGSDDCYVRWRTPKVTDYDEDAEYSTFYLDKVMIPNMYGIDGVPMASSLLMPKDSAVNVYNKNVELQWSEAQFAEGYKLYVGKTKDASDVINGQDLGNATSFTLPTADYATMYYWKVIPYNKVGDAKTVPVWHFTTIPDMTVKTFPWKENFESGTFPPVGWFVQKMGYSRWEDNNIDPYEGKYCVSASVRANNDSTTLFTPDIQIPADMKLQISFWWGNDMAVSLLKDNTTIRTNTTTGNDGIDAGFFDIYVDGKWVPMTMISDPNDEGCYWVRERFDLTPYQGKTVSFRWKYVGYNYYKAKGLSLDDISIADMDNNAASFNVNNWDAGKVNYNQSVTSDTLALANLGSAKLTVNKVEFAKDNFTTTLKAGDEIKVNGSAVFKITFNAKDAATTVTDNLSVTLSNGQTVSLPVSGEALPQSTLFYGFEQDAPGTAAPNGFITIDVDGLATPEFYYMNFPGYGLPYAFLVANTKNWNYVFDCPTGKQALVCSTPADGGTGDDWIVSNAITCTSKSAFKFDARNWEGINSVLPGNLPTLYCMVSTTSQSDRSSFKQVGDKIQMVLYDEKDWNHYSFDLSKYAGKTIYVALRSTVTGGLASFYDNFEFDGIDTTSGINGVVTDADIQNADATVYNVAGTMIASGKGAANNLGKGLYIVKIKTADGKTVVRRIVNK